MIREAVYSENYVEYIIDYNGDREALFRYYSESELNVLDDRYAILYQRKPDDYMESFSRLEYNLFPKLFGQMTDEGALEAIGAVSVKQEKILGLTGKGILLGIVDTGIDIFNSTFIGEDKRSKIIAAWDQTIETAGETIYDYGREYSMEEIQAAVDERQRILTDITGHGTFCTETCISVAENAEIVCVKLKQAKNNLRDLYGVPTDVVAYSEADIMTGIGFLLEQQRRLRRPMCIFIGLGSNSGSHTGAGSLEQYIDSIAQTKGLAVAVAGGNEGLFGHHYYGTIEDEYDVIELEASPGDSFTLEIWGPSTNTYSVGIEIPGGEFIDRISPRYDKSVVIRPIFGGGIIYVDYFLIEDFAKQELIMLRFIAPIGGVWKIRVYAAYETEPYFNAWLPINPFVSPGTKFLKSNPGITLTNPAGSDPAICVCAYDYRNGNLYINNSRGYTADGRVKPDVLAPGVNIEGTDNSGNTIIRSGTSISAAYGAGCAILMLEWSYEKQEARLINGNQIRGYLIRGAIRPGAGSGFPNIRTYPNPEWGYGLLNIYNTFESLRNV